MCVSHIYLDYRDKETTYSLLVYSSVLWILQRFVQCQVMPLYSLIRRAQVGFFHYFLVISSLINALVLTQRLLQAFLYDTINLAPSFPSVLSPVLHSMTCVTPVPVASPLSSLLSVLFLSTVANANLKITGLQDHHGTLCPSLLA